MAVGPGIIGEELRFHVHLALGAFEAFFQAQVLFQPSGALSLFVDDKPVGMSRILLFRIFQ